MASLYDMTWKSKCQASNHPPQGFTFPRVCPAGVGPTALARFQMHLVCMRPFTEYALVEPRYIRKKEALQFIAYIMKYNGTLTENVILDESNAVIFPLHASSSLPSNP